jgi:hypothetical protein
MTTWTARDLQIVEALTTKVRLLTRDQIARGWWRPSERSQRHAADRLGVLTKAGLLDGYLVNAHPLFRVETPVFRWAPGETDPEAEAVAERLQGRWTEAARPTMVYAASRLAANLYGSFAGRLPDLTHRDHDLLLGEVYLLYLRDDPEAAVRWAGEDTRPKAGYRVKDPDAFVLDGDGEIARVVESGGRYGRVQVEAFHEHCAEHDLPYELW